MRLFAGRGPIGALLDRTFREGDVLAHPIVSRSIAGAQRKVEQQNYAMRRRLLQYDDVLNAQREVVYSLRDGVLHAEKPWSIIGELLEEMVSRLCAFDDTAANGAGDAAAQMRAIFPIALAAEELINCHHGERVQLAMERIRGAYAIKERLETPETITRIERIILLRAIDSHWQEHLSEMDDLRSSVGLRSYAQKNPLYEYKAEAFDHFKRMMEDIGKSVAFSLFRSASSAEKLREMLSAVRGQDEAAAAKRQKIAAPLIDIVGQRQAHVGRNDVCPCGSRKKYKKCCGANK